MAAFIVCELSKIDESSAIEQKKKINNAICKKNGDPIPVYLLINKVRLSVCMHTHNYIAKAFLYSYCVLPQPYMHLYVTCMYTYGHKATLFVEIINYHT